MSHFHRCPNDWLYNFLYGGGAGAGGGTNLGSNDIIDHVLNCASGVSPCAGTSISITVGDQGSAFLRLGAVVQP
ncbi:MAG TPA: hypothetical protein VN924_26805 [Bryobacteraceae bacterium]|nr:hypothetical protein [Bryobacteraceae bacterium]